MSLKLIFYAMQVFQMHLRLNLEEVNAGHVIPILRQPGIRVAGVSESAMQLTSSGGSHYSYERLSTCAKNERTHTIINRNICKSQKKEAKSLFCHNEL